MIHPSTLSGRGDIHMKEQTDGTIVRDSSPFSVGIVNPANHYNNDVSQGRSFSDDAPCSNVDYKLLTTLLTVGYLA